MESLKIIALCVAAACVYGIVHDQITARICIEYFTIGHERIVDSTSPTVLGLVWGIVATWWMGLFLSIPVVFAARAGRRPWPAARLLKPIGVVLAGMAVSAACAGVIGYVLASEGRIGLTGGMAYLVPEDQHVRFMTAWWMHLASYAAAGIGGLALTAYIVLVRVLRK